jgi:hypothetical protein
MRTDTRLWEGGLVEQTHTLNMHVEDVMVGENEIDTPIRTTTGCYGPP